MFLKGDKVRISNVDLASYGAIGTIIDVYHKMAKVRLETKIPTFYCGNTLVNFSFYSIEHYGELNRPVKKSPSSNIALFFEDRAHAEAFLETGECFSEDGRIDIASAETLKDCEKFYEDADTEFKAEIEVMVFKGVLYEVKMKAVFEEVEDV